MMKIQLGTNKNTKASIKSEIESNDEVKDWTFDPFIDKNSLWRRTKKQILNGPNSTLPDYIKTPYPFLKEKPKKKD